MIASDAAGEPSCPASSDASAPLTHGPRVRHETSHCDRRHGSGQRVSFTPSEQTEQDGSSRIP